MFIKQKGNGFPPKAYFISSPPPPPPPRRTPHPRGSRSQANKAMGTSNFLGAVPSGGEEFPRINTGYSGVVRGP